jgi:uncharacterized membrane protein YdjX (TVP38/TMEM64 family)
VTADPELPPPPPPSWRKRHSVAAAILLLLVLAVAGGLYWYYRDVLPSAEESTLWLRALNDHWWTPLAFIGVFVILSVMMIPPIPLSAAAAVVFGWKEGAMWDLLAASLSAILPYYLSRAVASRWVLHHIAPRFPNVFRRLGSDPFSAIFLLRVVGVVPFVALNYLAGAARIRFFPYISGTVLGLAPPTLVFFYLIDAVAAGVLTQRGAALRVTIAGILTALLYLAGRYVAKRLRRTA